MYNEKSEKIDKELVSSWTEHVRDLMVLVRYACFFGYLNAHCTRIEWSTFGGYCVIPCTVICDIPSD